MTTASTLGAGMAVFKLPNGESTIVDDDLVSKLSQQRWQSRYNKVTGKKYVAATVKNDQGEWKSVYLHRYILGFPEGGVVDHINGNELDNRRANLRHTTQVVNCLNKKGNKNTTSKYKGVHKRERRSPWCASIKLPNGKYKNIGSFKTEIEAARAYDAFAKEVYGDVILTNGVG